MATAKKARTTTSKKKAAAPANGNATAPAKVTNPVNLEEAIRARAYQLFEERGYQHGRDTEDWLRAESEILARFGIRPGA
ncbi:MAG: DUF2934 domain-containing protein [Terriglobales bacterium]